MLLLMKFFKTSAWRNFHSIQLLGSSNWKFFYRGHFEILASASQHQRRHRQQHCKKNIFAKIYIFFEKEVEYLCSSLCLVMVSVPLCYKHLVLYDNLFIKSKASIAVLEKSYLNICKHPSWCFKKSFAPKISVYFAFFPLKHPALSSF